MKLLRDWILRLLRVPPPPRSPRGPGDDGSQDVAPFRASPRYYRYRLVGWLVQQAFALAGILFFLLFVRIGNWVPFDGPIPQIINGVEVLALAGWFVQLFWSLAMLRLDWEQRWYLLTDSSLKIREGLWRVREQTMTLANIQNMKVTQGPLQRLFGIAELEVETAGGGGKEDDEDNDKDSLHRGRLRGLENAEELRDRIRRVLAHHRDAGLGDPDDFSAGRSVGGSEGAWSVAHADAVTAAADPDASALVAAAGALVEASRALRAELRRDLASGGAE